MIISKSSPNEFHNYATLIDILQPRCHYIILQVLVWKWHFNIQVRYCHLLDIWCVFRIDMLISSFFLFCIIRYRLIAISSSRATSDNFSRFSFTLGMSSLFINYHKRFSRYLHFKFEKEVIFLGRFSPYDIPESGDKIPNLWVFKIAF